MEKSVLDELLAEKSEQQSPMAKIVRQSETEFTVNDHKYEIDPQFVPQFEFEDFRNRYNPAFSQYDYIVGDYSYDQLRLKGFFEDDRADVKGPFVNQIADFILDQVNFGAKFFVVHNLEARPITRRNNSGDRSSGRRRRKNSKNNNNHRRNQQSGGFVKQKVTKSKPPLSKRKNVTVSQEKKSHNKHRFVIKENKDNVGD